LLFTNANKFDVVCLATSRDYISCVPNFDYAIANEELQCLGMKHNYSCCGKSICKGCLYSSIVAGDNMICPFCKTEGKAKTGEDKIEELMKRVEANDADAMYVMGTHYYGGAHGLQQNQERAMELWKQASQLGSIDAHYFLGNMCFAEGGNEKSGARASGGAGVSCECRRGGMCRGELRILLFSIFGAMQALL
jgi:hypothetical protein